MAFGDKYMAAKGDTKPARRKAITGTIAIAAHVGVLGFAVVWSYVHVEEVKPPNFLPTLVITPPPAPPPLPLVRKGGHHGGKGPKIAQVMPQPAAPAEKSEPSKAIPAADKPVADEPEGDPDGSKDGVSDVGDPNGSKDGDPNGEKGGTGPAKPAPPPSRVYFIAPNMRQPEKLSGADPGFTAEARAANVTGDVVLKVCIGPSGHVTSATPVARQPMGLTEAALHAVQGWRYAPYTVNGTPVAACLPVRFQFRLTR